MDQQGWKHRIERGLEVYGRALSRHGWKIITATLILIAALATQMPNLVFDTSTESFFRADDPVLIAYNQFREQFGRDELVLIAVEPPDVFDTAFLSRLRDFHEALEGQVPHLREITSLVNVRNTRGEGDELIVEDLMENLPETPEAMAGFRERVMGSHLYPNFLISEDGRFTVIVLETEAFSLGKASDTLGEGNFQEDSPEKPGEVEGPPPLTDQENSDVIHTAEAVMAQFERDDFRLHLTGSPAVTDHLKRSMQSNMGRFSVLAILSIGVFLFLLFRRFSGVLIPLLVVISSVVITISLAVILGTSFKIPMMVLPSFLLAVGVGASVHLLTIFYRRFEATGDKVEAIAHALGHSGLPIVMTSLTTAAGLLSFVTATLASVGDLGTFAGLGVLISLILTMALTPALLSVLPLSPHPRWLRPKGNPWADRYLAALARFATGHALGVMVVTLLLTVLAIAGLFRLEFSHNTLKWFPLSTEIRRTTDLVDRELKGSVTVELVVDTGKENGLYEPEVLHGLERIADYAANYRNKAGEKFVGKTNSVADVVKEINQALNENRSSHYLIPEDRELIAQELLLFENSGSDDLERLVDSRFSKARLSIKTPWDDASSYVTFVKDLQTAATNEFGDSAQTSVSGLLRLFTQSIYAMMMSMVTSYSIAVVVITILMVLLIGRFGLGLLSMIPNLIPIVLTLGFMGWFGIPLDAFTMLIGSIALGLAVDDTIHFFHNYLRALHHTGSMTSAVEETLISTGRAMLFTTLVLATGFWLFMFATLNNLFYFGLLTGITIVVALLADLLVAPAMMSLLPGHGKTSSTR